MIVKIVIGFIAGIISGLFASGGGLILVPAYVYIIKMSEERLEPHQFYQYYQWLL